MLLLLLLLLLLLFPIARLAKDCGRISWACRRPRWSVCLSVCRCASSAPVSLSLSLSLSLTHSLTLYVSTDGRGNTPRALLCLASLCFASLCAPRAPFSPPPPLLLQPVRIHSPLSFFLSLSLSFFISKSRRRSWCVCVSAGLIDGRTVEQIDWVSEWMSVPSSAAFNRRRRRMGARSAVRSLHFHAAATAKKENRPTSPTERKKERKKERKSAVSLSLSLFPAADRERERERERKKQRRSKAIGDGPTDSLNERNTLTHSLTHSLTHTQRWAKAH